MNPSPSGYFNNPDSPMTKSLTETQRYIGEITGSHLDRIDIQTEVNLVPFRKLPSTQLTAPSTELRKRVTATRKHQTIITIT